MALHIYNTETRKKEKFKPMRDPDVRFYACGPTVYNYAHIGNLATYLMEDIVIRSLRFLGYRVDALMNITDIDDKTIRDSQATGEPLLEFTQKYTDIFNQDLKKLSIDSFDRQKPISELIPEMVELIQNLLDKGFAYIADDGSVYYSIKKFKKYGRLANLDMKGMKSSVRIDNDEYEKDSVADFVLWKAHNIECDGDNCWAAKLEVEEDGEKVTKTLKGRPGWHIECSACIRWGFKDQIDIHMGGCDLVFPHHQNEIAQSEGATGKQFCRYWAHSGHLLVDNKKMSKSAGNFYRLSDVVEKSDDLEEEEVYRAFRMMRLQNDYRDGFNFTFDKVHAAHNTLKNIDSTIKRIGCHQALESESIDRDLRNTLQDAMFDFVKYLEDDFDTVNALTVLFDLLGYINKTLDARQMTDTEVGAFYDFFDSINQVLVIIDMSLFDVVCDVPNNIQDLLDKRTVAKLEKRYDEADAYRQEIESLGWEVIDEKEGSRVEKK